METKNTPLINTHRYTVALAAAKQTRTELARHLGLTRSDLWRRVTGRTSWSVSEAHMVAELLAVPEQWLFSDGPLDINIPPKDPPAILPIPANSPLRPPVPGGEE